MDRLRRQHGRELIGAAETVARIESLRESLFASLEIAFLTMLAATVLGTLLAIRTLRREVIAG